MLKVQIYRYHPEAQHKPYMQSYTVAGDFRPRMVLDVLEHLHETDQSLAFRRSCREGVCGSDGMNINGKNRLSCITPVSEVLGNGDELIIRPLPGMPVIRDLVVDQSLFFQQYHSIKPWLINHDPATTTEHLSAPCWTVCTSASSAAAARPSVRHGGGTRTSMSAPPACCRPGALSSTVGTTPPRNAWSAWKIPSACSAAAPSATAPGSAPRV